MGGMGTRGWGGFAGKSCSFATNLIAHFVLLTSHCWWVSISSPSSFFFSFFAVVGYLNYIFIKLRYLSNDIFLLMYIMLLNKLT